MKATNVQLKHHIPATIRRW